MPRDRGHKHSSGFGDDSSGFGSDLQSKKLQVVAQQRQDPVASCIFGGIFFIAGTAVILLTVGVIPCPEEAFKAPRWVLGCVGALFASSGIMVLLQGLGLPPNNFLFKLLGPILLVCLAAPFGWLVFGDSHAPLEIRIIFGFISAIFAGVFVLAFAVSKNPRLLLMLTKNNPEVLEKIQEMERMKRNR